MSEWPKTGRCGACGRPARQFPSGRWEHHGRPCGLRSQTTFAVSDAAPAMLVFVPDGAELPQPRGRRPDDIARLKTRLPDIDWDAHFAGPTVWDEARERLRAQVEDTADAERPPRPG